MTKEEKKAYHKKYYSNHSEALKARSTAWARGHKSRVNEGRVKFVLEKKIEVLSHYGKDGNLQCCWPGCEVNDIDVLTLDHVNNDGCKDRDNRNYGQNPHEIRRQLIKEDFPAGYQTLCANHNLKKEILRRREGRVAI